MKLEAVKKVSVIGGGVMGNQIAELLARVGGYEVTLWDLNDELVNKGLDAIKGRLNKFFVEKGKMTAAQYEEITGRIKPTTDLVTAAKDADFIMEAIAEILDVKKDVFNKLDANCSPDTVIATNTSWLNIPEIAAGTQHKERIGGMHFFNPVAMMKLIEIVQCASTSEETVAFMKELAVKLGKEPVVCKDFSFGFLANRPYRLMRNEAVQMVWERVACPEDIDKALKLGYGLPMGPLELTDMTGGWKATYNSEDAAIKELGSEAGRVHTLIKMMVRAGYTGGPGCKGIYAFWDEVLSKW